MASAPLSSALLPFQREGVRLGVSMGGRLLLGDEMGLGKTVQAIAIALHYRSEWPLLVVCPTSLALTWAEELERWVPELLPGDINMVHSHHNSALATAKVTLLPYGRLLCKEKQRLADSVAGARFGVVVVDEAHALKSKEAQRYQLLLPTLRAARRLVLLTGTPALSRPVELWTLLNALRPDVGAWRQYKDYVERYCDAKLKFFGRVRRYDVTGCSHADELHAQLAQHVMVRRLKADVLSQLPEKRRMRVVISLPSGGRAAELAELEAQRAKLASSDVLGRQRLLSQLTVALASAKAAVAAEYTLELIGSTPEKRVLYFAHHLAALDAMESAAAAHGVTTFRIDGSVPAAERASLVSRFQSLPAGKEAIFVLSIQAGGQGLTLTSASTVVFGELRWVPGEMLQAEDRVHRLGQTARGVNIHYLVAKGSADEAMWGVLQKKVSTLGMALDGERLRLRVDGRSEWEGEAAAGGGEGDEGDEGGGGEDGGEPDDGAAALDAKAGRAREAKRDRARAAFNSLFGAAAEARKRGAASASPRAAEACSQPSQGGGFGSQSSAPIDLTGDDTERGGGAAGGARIDLTADETERGEGAAGDDGLGALPSWFSVSSLTGRIHALGTGEAPLPSGLGASALPHAIADLEPASLPAPLAEPRMLAAARAFVSEYESLTPAQRSTLNDRPLRLPILGVASAWRETAPRSHPSSARPASAASAASTASTASASAASATAPSAAAPSAASSSAALAPTALGSSVDGSTTRETSSARWAAAHTPPSGADSFVTLSWPTTRTARRRVWTQHFSTVELDASGGALPHCLYCVALVRNRVPDSPFCGETCASEFAAAEAQGSARRQLFERELGVCQACGFDCHGFYQKIAALPTEQARMQTLMGSPYSTLSGRLRSMLTAPKEGDFWEADHVVAVADGGGECGLDNMQTLCTPCHAAKTKAQAEASARQKRQRLAEGTADLRAFFSSQ